MVAVALRPGTTDARRHDAAAGTGAIVRSRFAERSSEVINGYRGGKIDSRICTVGVITGEGVGSEILGITLDVLRVLETSGLVKFEFRFGGKIGNDAVRECGATLTDDVVAFCDGIFADRGAVLCGPGGARFVYELRRRFDLFCKFVPLVPVPALRDTGVLRPEALDGVDILFVRENISGLYFGHSTLSGAGGEQVARMEFAYQEYEVERIVDVAARAAATRRRKLCVIYKPGAVGAIAELWAQVARRIAARYDVELRMLEVDNASYQLVANAAAFDVVVAPNMFGDVLADGAAVLLASRGMSCSVNYGAGYRAVYQTGHGAAYDLAGTGRANPLGQVLSAAVMLHESFGLTEAANAIWDSVNDVLSAGWRTADIMSRGSRLVDMHFLGEWICEALQSRLSGLQERRA
jgi:3-isopropylmalate dehydrogenase